MVNAFLFAAFSARWVQWAKDRVLSGPVEHVRSIGQPFDQDDRYGRCGQGMTGDAYLDNAATTKPDPRVVETVCTVMQDGFGNASAEHARGRRARTLLERSRQTIADALDVRASEVYFTSGGTESNNLAIAGSCRACRDERTEIVTSSLEHASVTKTVRGLKREGWPVHYVPARDGVYASDELAGFLNDRTALVTTMLVQNEMGYVLPLEEIVATRDRLAPQALVHTDAVQAFGKIRFKPQELGVDLASVSGHKIGGPQGIGALYVKTGTNMFTTAFGGGQERGLRSGTEALPLIAGFAKAVDISLGQREEAFSRVLGLKRSLLDGILALKPETRVNSRDDGSPYIVSVSIPGLDNTAMVSFLSERGVFISKASACETLHPDVPPEDWRAKHPLSLHLAGVPHALVDSTLRMSFSQRSTERDVAAFLDGFTAYFCQVGQG